MPEFKDERFTVNRVVLLDPVTVGYADPKAALKITDGLVRAVSRVAKMHGFEAVQTSTGIIVRSGEIVKDSWLDSITQLVSKYGVDLIFMALLFFLLPTTLAAISLITTPSLWFPYPVNVAITVALLLVSVYVFRKYIAENRPKR
jgi:hypothetical protein